MERERERDLVADSGTDGAGSSAVHQSTRVAVVPVLVTELLVGDGERAQLAVEDLPVLNREREGGKMTRWRFCWLSRKPFSDNNFSLTKGYGASPRKPMHLHCMLFIYTFGDFRRKSERRK